MSPDRPFGLDTWIALSPYSTVRRPLPDFCIFSTADIADHVSYGGSRPIYRSFYRSIHRPIYRLILGRVSVDTRSTDSPLNDAHGVGRHIDRDTVSGISVNYRLYIGRLLVKSRSILGRSSSKYRSIYRSSIDRCIDR